MAPSMAPTVLHSHTAPPSTVPPAVGRCRPWSTHLSDIDIQNGIRPRADQRSAPKAERRSDRSRKSVEGGVGPVEGREPHGPEACLRRVGQDAQPRSCRVRRTAHTSKRRPATWTYLQRPLNRTHRQPTESQLLTLTLLRLVAGAGLQSPATKPSLTVARPPRRIPRLILICCCAGCGRQPGAPSFDVQERPVPTALAAGHHRRRRTGHDGPQRRRAVLRG